MDTKQYIASTARAINELKCEGKEKSIVEVIPLRGSLAQLLGSETAAFYERAGLCCDD